MMEVYWEYFVIIWYDINLLLETLESSPHIFSCAIFRSGLFEATAASINITKILNE